MNRRTAWLAYYLRFPFTSMRDGDAFGCLGVSFLRLEENGVITLDQ